VRAPLGAALLIALAALAIWVLARPSDRGAGARADPLHRPVPVGADVRFRPDPAAGPASTCRRGGSVRHLAHLELFAAGRVVLVPAGIGVGGDWRLVRGRVAGADCLQPLLTIDPTGLILVSRPGQTLGDLFRIWRQPLSRGRMLSFRGRVRAYVNGRPRRGNPAEVRLRSGASIALEVGRHREPHADYEFPPKQAVTPAAVRR
jgi:hypothetical protein